jgi:hypothetical protein
LHPTLLSETSIHWNIVLALIEELHQVKKPVFMYRSMRMQENAPPLMERQEAAIPWQVVCRQNLRMTMRLFSSTFVPLEGNHYSPTEFTLP